MKPLRCFILLFACLVLAPAGAGAQVYTPERGSPERANLMDAIRKPVQTELGRPVIFVVRHLKISGEWAFAILEPRNPDGSPMDYRGTPFEEDYAAGMMSNTVIALVEKHIDDWRVAEVVIGATDVPYGGWWRQYGAPRAIFPYTED